ncbi:hypothetical protein [Amycolatopsis sp. CA-128772]|uniref:hypothetical protein n=1 Tax=Amycolatopsis sp. CA-128772 TaxID=2073159 RepID=UPI0018EA9501|nr:hypothetical protein [Amycolatopsis sp. CA-128772]
MDVQAALGERLTHGLGDHTAGACYDHAHLVVTSTDAEPRPFRRSEPAAVTDRLYRSDRIPGTVWRIDPREGQVRAHRRALRGRDERLVGRFR